MSIKKGYHYNDSLRKYYREDDGSKIPEQVCLCAAKEPTECCCDCTSWNDDEEYYDDN